MVGAVSMLNRLILEKIDPIECGAKLSPLGFKGSDLCLEFVVLAVRNCTKRHEFIAARLHLCL